VPIRLDASGIISSNSMDDVSWLWQLNREFSVAPLDRTGWANLVAPPSLDQIDKALLEFRGLSFGLAP
jgi:hypothetical protein